MRRKYLTASTQRFSFFRKAELHGRGQTSPDTRRGRVNTGPRSRGGSSRCKRGNRRPGQTRYGIWRSYHRPPWRGESIDIIRVHPGRASAFIRGRQDCPRGTGEDRVFPTGRWLGLVLRFQRPRRISLGGRRRRHRWPVFAAVGGHNRERRSSRPKRL